MVWDLGRAMRKKEEFESARLLDFEFRLRARTARQVALELGIDAAALVTRTIEQNHAGLIAALALETGLKEPELQALWNRLEARTRRDLVAERGNPAPYRLG